MRRHSGWQLTRHRPADDVADWIERHWVVRWDLRPGAGFTQEVLPHPCVNLVTEPGRVAVHGIPHERSAHTLAGSGLVVGTKFRPGAFAALAGGDAARTVGRSLPLDAVLGAGGAALERTLRRSAGDPGAHIAAVEAFVRARRPGREPRAELLRAVVADMLTADRRLGVAGFARRHSVSQSTLQRLFRDYVGVPPKWVLRRYRVHEAAERLASGEAVDGARLAAELGYFDQSHFIGDFTAQVGVSPGAYSRACASAEAA